MHELVAVLVYVLSDEREDEAAVAEEAQAFAGHACEHLFRTCMALAHLEADVYMLFERCEAQWPQ